MSLIEKIDEMKTKAQRLIVKEAHDRLDEIANDISEGYITACDEIKDYALSSQTEPSWKQYIRQRQITITDDHCVCGMAIDNGWEFCPKCGRQIKGRSYTVPKPITLSYTGYQKSATDINIATKTIGDLIRESNESLMEWFEKHQDGLFNSEGRTYKSCMQVIREHLNQPVESEE